MMVFSVVESGAAVASAAAGNAAIAVESEPATNVTNDSATLNGKPMALGGEDNAMVWFEYWEAGDEGNATATADRELVEPGTFSADVSGLTNDTEYVYVAHAAANGTHVTGDEVRVTADGGADEAPDNFGRRVSRFVHGLLERGTEDDQVFGHMVAQFVLANNPAADRIPGFAGPPGDVNDVGDRRGPPEHGGPPDDAGSDSDEGEEGEKEDDEEGEDEGDNGQGPPDHGGPPDHAEPGDGEDGEEDEDDDGDS